MGDLKPGWRRVKLGEVALNSTQVSRDPFGEGFTRYIIGKHIPADGGRITTWNPVGDAEFGSRIRTIFRPGDVICTTRGPYLKVAVPDFEGLSAHTNFILRTRGADVLLQPILEAVVRSDGFQEHLRKHFRGSTNLFVNWSDAAEYELALPPPKRQQEIAVALNESTAALESSQGVARAAELLLSSSLLKLFGGRSEEVRLVDLCELPITYGIVKAGLHVKDGVPYVRVGDITKGDELSPSEMLRTSHEVANCYQRTILVPGDIVMAVKAARGVVGLVRKVPESLRGANLSRDVARIPLRPEINRDYVMWALKSPRVASEVRRSETGWKGDSLRELTIGALRILPIPWMPLEQQVNVVNTLNRIAEAVSLSKMRCQRASKFHMQLLQHAFEDGA